MNTELQLIIYLIDEKGVWTVLVIMLSRGRICKHSVISVELLSCILLLQTTFTQNFCNDLHRGKKDKKKMVENGKVQKVGK